jgi:GT2 family glycosyltransferase
MLQPKYSLIIPLYNRPQEIKELLDSILVMQAVVCFEVIIVEDGSTVPSKEIVTSYNEELNIFYCTKTNSGPGLSRNYGAQYASGQYLIFLDSDVVLPPNFLNEVDEVVIETSLDAFGGSDRANDSFTPIQKSINYSMTSFFTTGGIRNKKKGFEKFHPRSFNMGIRKDIFDKLGGFSDLRFGEDIDFSIRLIKNGYQTGLIDNAFVYHKRRTDFKKFFKQVYNSGVARIVLFKKYPDSLKLVHFFPAVFTLGLIGGLVLGCWFYGVYALINVFTVVILVDATIKEKSLTVGVLSIIASYVQLLGYGTGFIVSYWNNVIQGKRYEKAFTKKFYD